MINIKTPQEIEEMKAAGSDPLKNEEELFRRSIVALS